MFNKVFLAFLEEAKFSKELLALGVTQLYNANYASKGVYFQSFNCLYSGLERIEKLCLILDYYTTNNGCLPQEKDIKKYGHNIISLFEACKEIADKHNIAIRFQCDFDDVHRSILEIINDFARSDGRYANINTLLSTKNSNSDCIEKWYKNVDMKIYSTRVRESKKQRIEENAKIAGHLLNQYAFALYSTEDNLVVTDAKELSRRTGIWQAVAKYRQLYVLQIIRYLSEMIMELGYEAMKINNEDIPSFSEIFGLFYNDDSYFKSRKTWDKLY